MLHPEGPTTGVAHKRLGRRRGANVAFGGGMGAAAKNFEAWFMHVLNVFPGETNNGICSPFLGDVSTLV